MLNLTYAKALMHADLLKALGDNSLVYLCDGPYPWQIAETCQPGGSHRLEMATSVRFTGRCPVTGLEFSWCADVEPRSANYTGSYDIDVNLCHEVLAALKGRVAEDFKKYLLDAAAKVRAKGVEFQDIAKKQFGTADMLWHAANPTI